MLFLLGIGGIGFGYVKKSLSLELSYAALVILGIIGINYLANLEMIKGFLSPSYSYLFLGCLIWILYWFWKVFFSLLKRSERLDETFKRIKNRLILISAVSFFISIPFGAIITVNYKMLQIYSPLTIKNMANNLFFKYTTISLGLVILALCISFIYLLKTSKEDLKKVVMEEKNNIIKFNVDKIKRHFMVVFFASIFVGSIFETKRGMWVFWIETILLVGLMSLIIWKLYQHVFSRDEEKT